jgi:2-haloacid dehalogenase
VTTTWDAVVFDLGGVLIDWDPRRLYRLLLEDDEAVERFLETVCTPAWNHEQDAGRSLREGTDTLVASFPEHEPLIRAYYERWEEMLGEPVAGAEELLEEVGRAGVRRLALTNWSSETFPIARERFPWLARFDGIVVSGEEGVAKPDPRVFRVLLERFAVRADRCVYVDDAPANVRAAEELGFRGIVFPGIDTLRRRLRELGIAAA